MRDKILSAPNGAVGNPSSRGVAVGTSAGTAEYGIVSAEEYIVSEPASQDWALLFRDPILLRSRMD